MIEIHRDLSASAAWDLIYPGYLSKLSVMDQETMQRSMKNSSHLWLARHGDAIPCVMGTIAPTLLSDTAYLWFYSTPDFTTHRLYFARISRHIVTEALSHYPSLWGHCMQSSPKSIRWLRWLGADFHPPQGPALPFELKAKQ